MNLTHRAKIRSRRRTPALIALLAIPVALAFAGGTPEQAPSEAAAESPRALQLAARHTASDLAGAGVVDEREASLGEVDELLLDLSRGWVSYFVLDLQETEGVGDGRYPVPLALVYPNVDGGTLMFPLTRRDLLDAAPVMSDYPADERRPAWQIEIERFWTRTDTYAEARPVLPGYRPVFSDRTPSYARYSFTAGAATSAGPVVESGRIRGAAVLDEDEEPIGEMVDFVVSLASGRVPYALVAPDDADGVRPVPLSLFVRPVRSSQWIFQGSASQLADAPRLSSGDDGLSGDALESLRSVEWDDETMTYWAGVDASARYRYGARVVPGLALQLSDFLGYRLVNGNRQGLGRIDDVVVTRDGLVLYALVEFSAYLATDGGTAPIPLSAIEVDPYRTEAIVDLSRDELEALPVLAEGALPSGSADWDRDVRSFWRDRLAEFAGSAAERDFIQVLEQREGGRALRATRLRGFEVVSAEGTRLGPIENVLIDVQGAEVAFVMVERPRQDPPRWVPVPLRALRFDAAAGTAELSTDVGTFESAPAYPVDVHPVVIQGMGWTEDVRDHWAR